ncbi:MAG: MiaB/RimO family radical SAM methylthiotransferase [Endomicrobium sp.]|jgi:threonylcarbamoyladenosine tRNA methylthiotransferase MtaB|nr:MiaB/RimO family radical SAM methylthiotransferase [Endomicrobium sp.]
MKNYYIYTFGCKVNQYESRLIADKLKEDGGNEVLNPQEADIIIFNSCTVTGNADKECQYFLRKSLKLTHNPKIILTGCFAKNKNEELKKKFPEIEIIDDKTKLYAKPESQTVKTFAGRSRAFLKIQDGCSSFCSYCIVPYVRNSLWSKPENDVLSEIKNFAENGYPEIVLTGIHVGKYFDAGSRLNFSGLVEKIAAMPLDFRIRISSIELNEIDDKLIKLMKDYPDKICRHMHIPLQSGSDEILKLMNRKYLTADFEKKTKALLADFADLALTTDIITGFPGETGKHHNETAQFIKQTKFARLHIFRYSDRQGAQASKFNGKVPSQEIKRRSEELFEIDALKRKDFLSKNSGKKRKAVSIGKNKALTDNYITVLTGENVAKTGIFEVELDKTAEI